MNIKPYIRWGESNAYLLQLDEILKLIQNIKDETEREKLLKALRAVYVTEQYKRMDIVDEMRKLENE